MTKPDDPSLIRGIHMFKERTDSSMLSSVLHPHVCCGMCMHTTKSVDVTFFKVELVPERWGFTAPLLLPRRLSSGEALGPGDSQKFDEAALRHR